MNLSNYKSLIKVLFALVFTSLLFGCKFGLFNKDYPTSSRLSVFLDNEENLSASSSGVFSFDIDSDVASKYLKLSLDYIKSGEDVDVGGFNFSCETLTLNRLDDNSCGIDLTKVKLLGSHTINIKSTISSIFDKTFIVNLVGRINDFDIYYCPKNENIINNDLSLENIINTKEDVRKPIKIASGVIYSFNISNSNALTVPDLSVEVSNTEYVKLEVINNCNFNMSILECPNDTEFRLNINIKNKSVGTSIPFVTKSLKSLEFNELKKQNDGLTLNLKSGMEYQYSVELFCSELESSNIYGCFCSQDDDKNISKEIDISNFKAKFGEQNEYMYLYFDNEQNLLSIKALKDTVEIKQNGIENLYLYIYFYDRFNNFINRLRISIGGVCDNIETNVDCIDTQTQRSGRVSVNLYPSTDDNIIWYFSKFKGAPGEPPEPMLKSEVCQILSALDEQDGAFNVNISSQIYNAGDYFICKSSNLSRTFVFKTGSQAFAGYLVALVENSNVYCQIPFMISSECGVIVKSEHCVINKNVPFENYKDTESFEHSFTNKNLPLGQGWPDTYENGNYGDLTRSFYLPHNKETEILIKTTNIDGEPIVSSAKSASNLFTCSFEKGDALDEYVLTITPAWLSNYKLYLQTDGLLSPAMNIREGVDSFGRNFYQYLGVGTVYLKAGGTEINLRIVIYNG